MKKILITIALLILSLPCGCFIPYPVESTVTVTAPPVTDSNSSDQNEAQSGRSLYTTPVSTATSSISSHTITTPPITSNVIPELNNVIVSDQLITKDYKWDYEGREWTWELSFRQSLYDYYKALPRSPTRNYSVYVTNPIDDKQIDSVVSKLQDAAKEQGYDSFQTISFAAAFVQSLEYTSDSVTTGFDEYARYPIETLVDGGGDCEDTAILLASIIDSMGYGVVLIRYTADSGTDNGHLAVGVRGDESLYGTSFTYEGSKYYYVETTGTGWEIGQLPEEYKGREAYLYKMLPVPILTHDWESEGKLGYIQLTVTVENLGSATANNVRVFAAFDAGDDLVWNKQYSQYFNIGINEISTVILHLEPPWGQYTRVVVKILHDGYSVDSSYGKWVQIPSD
jgi:hypothetical protein